MTIKAYTNQANNFAMITSVSVSSRHSPLYVFGSDKPVHIAGPTEIRFEGVMMNNGFAMQAVHDIMEVGTFPFYKKEWRCLYCGGVNVIDSMKCVHCNAPRNYLLG